MNECVSLSEPAAQPLVTVITASFNLVKAGRAEYFRQCVESVHAQTYGAIEHLVIDGASQDGTAELIAEYESKGWLRCHSERDEGLYDAMNKGIQLAQGKYIAFLNSDDYWHDARAVEESVRCMEESAADFSYAPCSVVSEEGARCHVLEPRIEGFFCEMPFVHQTMFCRTELLRRMGGFDRHQFSLSADNDLIYCCFLSRGWSSFVPRIITSFRAGGASSDHQSVIDQIRRVHLRHYAHLIGEEDASRLALGVFPTSLPLALASRVSPEILLQLARNMRNTAHCGYSCLQPGRPASTRWTCLLGLPLMSRRSERGKTTWSLFGCIPLLVFKTREKSKLYDLSCHLLGCIPLWRKKTRAAFTTKHYLFSFIPIWGSRRR